MSSHTLLRSRASLSYALLAVSMSVVVSCVTVAPTPGPADPQSPLPTQVTSPSPEVIATPEPTADATPAASAALEPEVVRSADETPSSDVPTDAPTAPPTLAPTDSPTTAPTAVPTEPPTLAPAAVPTAEPTLAPTPAPTESPTRAPTESPFLTESPAPSAGAAAAAVASPASPDLQLDEKTVKRLDTILRNQVRNGGVVGLQAAVRLPSGEVWTGTAGSAELTPDRPIEDDTQFAIASVTKTFIAALILQLAEEGKIDLDAPVVKYFRDVPRGKRATIRQLLSHTSGIYNFFESPRYTAASKAWWESPNAGGLNARDHEWTYDEIMGLVRASYFAPGEDYHYSNTNYVILGRIAEAVGGQPLHRQLRQRFFRPLGLEDTVYQPVQKPESDAAHGHWNYGTGYTDHTREADVIPFMAAVSVADAAGAMASSASDLALWAEKLYGGEVLSEGSLAEMTTFLRPGTYGLGTDVATFAGQRAHGHRGGLRGYEASMWYFPDTGVSIALLSNQGNWVTDEPMQKLARVVFSSG